MQRPAVLAEEEEVVIIDEEDGRKDVVDAQNDVDTSITDRITHNILLHHQRLYLEHMQTISDIDVSEINDMTRCVKELLDIIDNIRNTNRNKKAVTRSFESFCLKFELAENKAFLEKTATIIPSNEKPFRFPDLVGFLDECLFNLQHTLSWKKPESFGHKCTYFVNTLRVCNHQKKICYLSCRYFGSMNNARVFEESTMGSNPNNFFSGDHFLINQTDDMMTMTMKISWEKREKEEIKRISREGVTGTVNKYPAMSFSDENAKLKHIYIKEEILIKNGDGNLLKKNKK
ncbi:hypothetical protein PHYBLDRAFT_64480 [Phycomyces blakesleeanus NRRL 1555(-)]|uniref:DDE Tnp4 domain-containing protein n=1 Tax=Phycomyces blakesleeanus (strain ATCC 8743b / DSM 1359 / FGSC 10004 / NBRC 33097 / NRRL 1555) TaxID=763407 RepID=A0A167NB68_PHYB8|nr:hypothetical protein PHYBLDRAFT_64480 [Phycomyces blakesleeanus NRRL 1555(-)]OAD75568.1 hypothetical protein PHYBLDRAFT_64480 [Phycomyces blakesleeanus NRRL 1555(-)]|eukprot:XP_018293608.1 hypothetical protein PHYBLDRAFT_64480 [Phycomyces blakesleeanus NRRL 1555(-)]